MTPLQVVKHYGRGHVPAAAKALNLTPSCLYAWIKNGVVPASRQARIQIATRGKLRADK